MIVIYIYILILIIYLSIHVIIDGFIRFFSLLLPVCQLCVPKLLEMFAKIFKYVYVMPCMDIIIAS